MVSLSSLKPFLPLLFTFVLPRAISFYRTVKTAVRTRPPSRPLPADAARSLNILFILIVVFLFWATPFRSALSDQNIFTITNSRLHIPTDVLFTRLALVRPNRSLTAFDELLKTKITSPVTRQLYMRFGPSTLVNCSFCMPEDDASYLLYHLPTNILLPHLVNIFAIGLATSEPIAGFETRRWRTKFIVGALALAIVDVSVIMMVIPHVDGNQPSPVGMFWQARVLRPLILCFSGILMAFLVYASATHRFLLFSPSTEYDPLVARKQREQMLAQTNVSLHMAQTRLQAYSIARNATVRESTLKAADDEYWRVVVAMEGPTGVEGVWQEEEVQAAIAKALGSGNIDMARMEREAESFVSNITKGLNEGG